MRRAVIGLGAALALLGLAGGAEAFEVKQTIRLLFDNGEKQARTDLASVVAVICDNPDFTERGIVCRQAGNSIFVPWRNVGLIDFYPFGGAPELPPKKEPSKEPKK